MIRDYIGLGIRASLHLRLVAFDALVTLVACVPMITGVAISILASVRGLEHWLASEDPRLRSLAYAEALHQLRIEAALAGIVSSLVLLLVLRTVMAGGLSSCVSHRTRPSIHEIVSTGVRNFGFNLGVTIVWAVSAGALVTVSLVVLLPVWYLTTGNVHVFFAGAAVGFFGALAMMLYASIRAVCDFARVVRRVYPSAPLLHSMRTALRWFFRIPITAGVLALTWIVAVLLLETPLALIEAAAGIGNLAGIVLPAALLVLGILVRSAITVARYASFSSLGELLWNFEQDEENERFLATVPQAMWVLPPSDDVVVEEEDWPDWIPFPGRREIDH